ncbi:MAG TPA: ABC transporter ATP-binding protein [Tepidisphaeraceae bacterium]|nr:ABC transporter ATP-binding protein [Tepidisphaeraceae bacterium]
MKYFPRVLKYLRPYWRLALFAVAILVVGALVGLLVPWPLKILFDHVLVDAPPEPWLRRLVGNLAADRARLMLVVVVAGFAFVLLQDALNVLGSYVNVKVEQNMVLDFRSDLFQHAQRLSLAFHDQRRSGMLIYAVNFQGDAAARLVMTVPPLAQSAITLVGMFWIVYRMDRTLGLLSLSVIPFLFYSVRYYVKHIQARLAKVMEMEGESLSIVHEAISMLRVIVAFGREDHEHRRFRDQGRRAVGERVKVTVRQTLFTLAVNAITAAGTALVLGYGAWQVIRGKLSAGDLILVTGYLAAVYRPLETISTTIGSLQDVFMSLKMAFDLMDMKPEIRDEPGAVDVGRARGHVRFENVGFSYTGRTDTLTNISFDAQPGQVVAIVGPTGAGKSTLVSLVPRFYAPNSGRILLDGRDLRQVTLKSLRRQISMVLQEPLLFSGTVAENIRYGRLDATDADVIEAAKAANAHDFIERLPQRYDTVVGERGAQLSGGERQRISVARAFLRDAPILILDEPTSSIDSRTETVILDALDRLMDGRTTFMIAHRLSTIRKADVILVVDRGRIVERGAHEELLEQGGLYRQLHDIQAGQSRESQDGEGAGADGEPEALQLGTAS